MKRTFALLLLCLFTAAAGCHVQQLRTAPEKEDPAASGIVQEQPQLPDGVMPEAPWNEEKKEPELTQEKEQTVFITAEESYFSDAVFIGASRLEGLALYAPIQGATMFYHRGLMVGDVANYKLYPDKNPSKTALDVLNAKRYGKVYLDFGVNELGYSTPVFIKAYRSLLEAVKQAQPDAQIYLCGIIPVTASQEKKSNYVNNENVRSFNQAIADLAEEYGAVYLDTYACFVDADGCLPEEISTDGVHLKYDKYTVWRDFLFSHAVAVGQEI